MNNHNYNGDHVPCINDCEDDDILKHELGDADNKKHEMEANEKETPKDPTHLESFLMVAKLSILPVISMFFYMFVQLINTYFIGHTNVPVLIAGVGMGNMLINVLGFAVG